MRVRAEQGGLSSGSKMLFNDDVVEIGATDAFTTRGHVMGCFFLPRDRRCFLGRADEWFEVLYSGSLGAIVFRTSAIPIPLQMQTPLQLIVEIPMKRPEV